MKKAYTVGLKGEEYSSLFNDFYVSNADAVDAMWRAGSAARIANSTQAAPKKVVRDAGELTRLATEKKYTQRKSTVRKASTNYSEEIAKVFVDNYDPSVIPSTYRKGFEMAYQAGLAGAAVDEIDESVSDMLSHDQIMAAYNAGRSESYGDERYSRNAEATEQAAKTTEQRRSQEKSGLVRDENTKKAGLSSTNEKVLDHYGKAVEAEIRFAPHIYDEYGNEANGSYVDGVITISLNSNDPYMTVFWHEAIHRLRSINTDAYTQLRDFVADAMGDEYFGKLLGAYESVYHGDKAYVSEEIVADAMGRIGSEEEATRRFAENHKDLARTLLDIIKDIINAIKRMFTGKTDKELSQEQRDVMKPIYDRMQEAVSLLDEALSSTAEKHSATNMEVAGATRNSTKQSWYEKSFADQIEDWEKGLIPPRDSLIVCRTPETFQKISLNSLPMTINQTHVDYAINGTKDFDHVIGKEGLKQLPKALERPVAIISSKTKNGTSLVAMLEIRQNGKQVIVPVEIDGYGTIDFMRIDSNAITSVYGKNNSISKVLSNALTNEANGKTFSVYYVDIDKTTRLFEGARVPMPKMPQVRSDGFVHSIRESGSPVKAKFGSVTETQQFKRWFGDWKNRPESASKVVNSDGTPRVVYHGTPDKTFTTFDTSKAENGSLGKGFYFAGSEEYAKGHTIVNGKFSGRVIGAYLNARNPYVVNSPGNIDTEKLKKQGYDAVYHPGNDFWVVFSPEQIKSATDNIGTFDRKNPDIRFSRTIAEPGDTVFYDDRERYSKRVDDGELLKFLNGQKTIKTYKTMQLVDGELHPPMASRINGKYEDSSVLGRWEEATEHPELIKEGNKFKLDKGKGNGSIEAAYNPYMHSSNLVINDQFSGAYTRDNLVTVECEVPSSELTSGYRAELAKDTVGWHPWHTGTVAGQVRKEKGIERKVFLSRWIKPVRIIPDSEVAAMYKEMLDGTDIAVPDNVVTPSLLAELEKAGVKIQESGRLTKNESKEKPRFSMSVPVEETKDLLAVHNLSAMNLTDALELGGLPMPSIAVIKAKNGHEKYGDISLVFSKNTIDPQKDRRNKVYGADAWTPTAPTVEYEINEKKLTAVEKELYQLAKDKGVANGIFAGSSTLSAMGIKNGYSGTYAELVKELADTETVQAAYLAEHGKTLEPVMKEKEWNNWYGNDILKSVIERVGIEKLEDINDKLANHEKAEESLGDSKDIITAILRKYYADIGKHLLQKAAERHQWTEDEINQRREKNIDNSMKDVSIWRYVDIVQDAVKMYQDGGKTKGVIDRYATRDALRAEVRGEDVAGWIAGKANSHIRYMNDVFDATITAVTGKNALTGSAQRAVDSAIKIYSSTADAAGGEVREASWKVLHSPANAGDHYQAVTESALEKLSKMSDEEFEKLELYPDFDV